jgi:tetratricopeptide (TPR) repeat protein
MVPPASVLTNKNCAKDRLLAVAALTACVWFSGCTPAGPRALLQGEKLIQESKYAEAIEKLRKATELLPKTAQAWNHLGLAFHGNNQPDEALKAYRIALSLDHKLAAAHFNLGCLYLEQNNLAAAADELTSYKLLQPTVIDGWLKLGSAHLRARRLDYAESCFKQVLDLHPRHPEAFNGLGVIQFQRRRWQDAANYFNAALAQNGDYGPALLNSAIVQQQAFNNRPAALQRYRHYLALQPRPADADMVEATARQLDLELNPVAVTVAAPAARPAPTNMVTQLVPRTNAPSSRQGTTLPAPTLAGSNPRAVSLAPTNQARNLLPAPPLATNTNIAASRPTPETTRTASRVPESKAHDVEVTQVPADLVVRPPQDLSAPSAPATARPTPSDRTLIDKTPTNAPKRGLLAKLNPFTNRARTDNAAARGTAPTPADAPASTETVPAAPAEPSAPAPPPIPRYSYLAPARPTPGNRAEAEQSFARGLKAQQSSRRAQAINEYQLAVKSDPAYFDAYYNLGLAALDAGEAKLSLWAYEIALALKPESADARYNFALALKAGGYFQDAADQLTKLLQENPADARGHLSLGNLFAQQLRQPAAAREHYEKVLELNPRHPEAAKIRYWIAANP